MQKNAVKCTIRSNHTFPGQAVICFIISSGLFLSGKIVPRKSVLLEDIISVPIMKWYAHTFQGPWNFRQERREKWLREKEPFRGRNGAGTVTGSTTNIRRKNGNWPWYTLITPDKISLVFWLKVDRRIQVMMEMSLEMWLVNPLFEIETFQVYPILSF